jgi:hypothetical protein
VQIFSFYSATRSKLMKLFELSQLIFLRSVGPLSSVMGTQIIGCLDLVVLTRNTLCSALTKVIRLFSPV